MSFRLEESGPAHTENSRTDEQMQLFDQRDAPLHVVTIEVPQCTNEVTVLTRTLKIEEDGDHWKGNIKPKIRLKGGWLERAGFKPGTHVTVRCLAPGLIELHSKGTPLRPTEAINV